MDRNSVVLKAPEKPCQSLSARRAWIEMTFPGFGMEINGSLSARRAWIEMFSVREVFANFDGRSPQGERG